MTADETHDQPNTDALRVVRCMLSVALDSIGGPVDVVTAAHEDDHTGAEPPALRTDLAPELLLTKIRQATLDAHRLAEQVSALARTYQQLTTAAGVFQPPMTSHAAEDAESVSYYAAIGHEALYEAVATLGAWLTPDGYEGPLDSVEMARRLRELEAAAGGQ